MYILRVGRCNLIEASIENQIPETMAVAVGVRERARLNKSELKDVANEVACKQEGRVRALQRAMSLLRSIRKTEHKWKRNRTDSDRLEGKRAQQQ